MEIWFGRHGETLWNAERRFQGQNNSPLTALGRSQARAQGDILRRAVDIGAVDIVVSPLGRVIETVELALPGVPYRTDDDLMEVHVGAMTGATLDERVAYDPRFGSDRAEDIVDAYFAVKDGERRDDFEQRIAAALSRLTRPTIIFAHGMVGHSLRGQALGLSISDRHTLAGGQGVIFHIKDGVERILRG